MKGNGGDIHTKHLDPPELGRIYLQVEGIRLRVKIGYLEAGHIPQWMQHPEKDRSTKIQAYVYLPSDHGSYRYTTTLKSLAVDTTVSQSRVFLKGNNVLYVAIIGAKLSVLVHYDCPAIFLLYSDKTIVGGVLTPYNERVPKWVL